MNFREPQGVTAHLERHAFLLLMAAVTIALALVLRPFYGTILWAAIVALLFAPLHRRLRRRLHGHRNAAALLTLLIVLVLAVIPLLLLSAALSREALSLFQRLQSGEINPGRFLRDGFESLPGWLDALLARVGLDDFDALQQRFSAALAQASHFLSAQALSIGQYTFGFIARCFITLYLAFYFFRDGDALLRALEQAIPLPPEDKRELAGKFATVIRATIRGNLFVAAVQGTLGGLAFWVLDVRGALLWAVLMALLSLLPAVGSALVWAPVAFYFVMSGAVPQGLALAAFGLFVIGLIDNLLRPMLVGKDTRMPDWLVLVTTLGGLALFGVNGFVLGPTIAAMFIAVWHIYIVSRAAPKPPLN